MNVREIKFRGISQYTGEMVYGQLLRGENNFNIVTSFNTRAIDIELVPIKKGTQGQYTGLKDKYGREIYEGDIVEQIEMVPFHDIYDIVGVVKFMEGAYFLEYERNGKKRACQLFSEVDEHTVMGNIYEHPELVGVSE